MQFIKNLLSPLYKIDNPLVKREAWVKKQLESLEKNTLILDAGCGPQPFKEYCSHLSYKSQDFGQYDGQGNGQGLQDGDGGSWHYGKLDYTGDIWNIDEEGETFDAILCTEVLEHIPYPNETIIEFARLLKKGGKMIITAPYACLPHMEPYFFYSGFSEDFYKKHADDLGLKIKCIEKNSGAYSFVFQEFKRIALNPQSPLIHKFVLIPLFLITAPFLKLLTKSLEQPDNLHFGYHVILIKK